MTTFKTAQLLSGKHAIVLGAGGAVGGAVAREFAAEGAEVFLSGRTRQGVEAVADRIKRDGGTAHAATVDAVDDAAVVAYLDDVVAAAGSIDVVYNATGPQPREYGNGSNTLELPAEQFLAPFPSLVLSNFITARAAARHMVQQHSGVILFVTAVPALGSVNVAAIGAAFGAMESLLRCLAIELGPAGVRVVGIRSGAMVETRTIQQSVETVAQTLSIPAEQIVAQLTQDTLLKRNPTAADTARLAAFLASDRAPALTGAIVNATSGMRID
jgi:NAD(P)-dependent dehydrogenase (short-subunit alcohol dehydrogenase family)